MSTLSTESVSNVARMSLKCSTVLCYNTSKLTYLLTYYVEWSDVRWEGGRRPTLVGDGISVSAGAGVENRVTVQVGGEGGCGAGHDLQEVLLVRDGRPADGVAAERRPRRQSLVVEYDVVTELAPRHHHQHVVENDSSLHGRTQHFSSSSSSSS